MGNTYSTFSIEQIGTVVSDIRERHSPEFFRGRKSSIEVRSDLEEALDGLEDVKYIMVMFYFHKSDPSKGFPLKVHPHGNTDKPLRGVFATHSPRRPNFLGVTKCKLLSKNGLVLEVEDLDAIDGTPVIDIKPCW
jgi:tRNA-Thr(GGU) m(6)t(6)A37 methyltransferase TsaA